ncbi:MAG: 23S rRNA (adenine(1618)-N(6))-methyltransferase RlmF [Acidobacteriota bacterium]|nr:23S rRNA (adenine(1618)-N(6))-methyltransferase RlmF [Acidobacteriota bacterium]
MKPRPKAKLAPGEKPGLHPRNPHRHGYDFDQLIQSCPELGPFVRPNAYGDASIDYADPVAVKTLNRALLKLVHRIDHWDLPPGFLCPPVPGRADYLHHLADLLAESNGGKVPRGPRVRVLDIGVGANVIYPLVGHATFGWRFLGSDIDAKALAAARSIVEANDLSQAIEVRRQTPPAIFRGLLKEGETFDLSLCNPPFHASPEEAQAGSRRKWTNLGRSGSGKTAPALNFGGQGGELWCEGGEAAFVRRMILESAEIPTRCLWFTTLLSKSSNLQAVLRALKQAQAQGQRIIPMAQGQKQSRIVAWTFFTQEALAAWAQEHWGETRHGLARAE